MEDWKLVAHEMPPNGIRVVGAKIGFVVGDIYFGPAGIMLKLMGDAEYCRERCEDAWRYTQGGDKIKSHMQPTHWVDLPDAPEE